MVLTDSQVLSLIESSNVILNNVLMRLNVELMTNNTFEPKTIIYVIDKLTRKESFYTTKKIKGFTTINTVYSPSDLTDEQIITNLGTVRNNLRQVISRLKISPMKDKSFSLNDIKLACDALIVKHIADDPKIIIDELTTDCQLKYIPTNALNTIA